MKIRSTEVNVFYPFFA